MKYGILKLWFFIHFVLCKTRMSSIIQIITWENYEFKNAIPHDLLTHAIILKLKGLL